MSNTPPDIDMRRKISRVDNVLFTQVDKDKVMIDPETGRYFGLNEIASEIWDMLETPQTGLAICQELEQRFEVDSVTCLNETKVLLSRMARLNLITVGDAAAG